MKFMLEEDEFREGFGSMSSLGSGRANQLANFQPLDGMAPTPIRVAESIAINWGEVPEL